MQRNQSAAKRRWADRNNAPPQCRWRLRLTAQQPPRRRKQSNGRVWEMRRRQLHKYRRRAEAWLIVPLSPKDPAGSPCDRPSDYLLRRVGPPIPSSAQTPCSRAPSAVLMRLREQCCCLNCAKLSRTKSQIVMNTPLWPLCECYMMHAAATARLVVGSHNRLSAAVPHASMPGAIHPPALLTGLDQQARRHGIAGNAYIRGFLLRPCGRPCREAMLTDVALSLA
jgi:hypothetical protein